MKDPRRIKTICQLLCCYWEKHNQEDLAELLMGDFMFDVSLTEDDQLATKMVDDNRLEEKLRNHLMGGE